MTDSNKDLIFKAAILIAGYQLAVKPLLVKFGVLDDPKKTARDNQKNEDLEAHVESVLATQKPTKSTAEWQIVADTVYESLNEIDRLNFPAYRAKMQVAAITQIEKCRNDADVILLYKLFAKRCEKILGRCVPGSPVAGLSVWVNRDLTPAQIKHIHTVFAFYKIKFRF